MAKRNWRPTDEEEMILLLIRHSPSQAHLWPGVAARVFAWIRDGNGPAIRSVRLALAGQSRPQMGAPPKGMKSALVIYLIYELMKAVVEHSSVKEIKLLLERWWGLNNQTIPSKNQPAARAASLLSKHLGVSVRTLSQRLKAGRAEWLVLQENLAKSACVSSLNALDLKQLNDTLREKRRIMREAAADLRMYLRPEEPGQQARAGKM